MATDPNRTTVSTDVPRLRLAQLCSLIPEAPGEVHAIGRYLSQHLTDSTVEPDQFVLAYELVLCTIEGRLPNLSGDIEDCLQQCEGMTDVLRSWAPRVARTVFPGYFAAVVAAIIEYEIASVGPRTQSS